MIPYHLYDYFLLSFSCFCIFSVCVGELSLFTALLMQYFPVYPPGNSPLLVLSTTKQFCKDTQRKMITSKLYSNHFLSLESSLLVLVQSGALGHRANFKGDRLHKVNARQDFQLKRVSSTRIGRKFVRRPSSKSLICGPALFVRASLASSGCELHTYLRGKPVDFFARDDTRDAPPHKDGRIEPCVQTKLYL